MKRSIAVCCHDDLSIGNSRLSHDDLGTIGNLRLRQQKTSKVKMHLLLFFNNLPGDLEDSIENEGSKLCDQTY